MANKWVYMFSEGDMTMRNLLGGKGANLAEMTRNRTSCTTGISQSQQRLVLSTMKMVVRLTTRSWLRLWKALRKMEESQRKEIRGS